VLKFVSKTEEKSSIAILKINAEYGRHCGYCASPGHDIGIVTTGGGENPMKKKGANPDSNEVPKIYRKASQKTLTSGLHEKSQ
jgi:hypothetical protein